MAQLGARLNGIQKVRGSNPLISSKTSQRGCEVFLWVIAQKKKETSYAMSLFFFSDIQRCVVGGIDGV